MKGPSRNPLESYKKIVILEVVIYKDKGKLIYENLNEMNNNLILVILLFCITGCKEKNGFLYGKTESPEQIRVYVLHGQNVRFCASAQNYSI